MTQGICMVIIKYSHQTEEEKICTWEKNREGFQTNTALQKGGKKKKTEKKPSRNYYQPRKREIFKIMRFFSSVNLKKARCPGIEYFVS